MRALAILGPGPLARAVNRFQLSSGVRWTSEIGDADAAIVFGGDGTIHHQLRKLLDFNLPLLVVPVGSGNDFARALGLIRFGDSVRAWRKFDSGGRNVRAIDLGLIRSQNKTSRPWSELRDPSLVRYFCCVSSVGLDAEIARRAEGLPRWVRRHGGYACCAWREFFRFAAFAMSVVVNGEESGFRPTLLVAVANAATYGGGMKIAPKASLSDGKLDVCRVGAMNRVKLACLFPSVYVGRHLCLGEVEYRQVGSVVVETEPPAAIYADGEYVAMTPAEFTVARQALRVIVPEEPAVPARC
jgi:diacylglycerol kinase (ATP)